jgi:hypothetical protein
VFFNRLGETRDCSVENQRYRASGLTLVTAAIVLWNTVYMERAITRSSVHENLRLHLSPLGWEHINLTGLAFHEIGGGASQFAIDARRQCLQRALIPIRPSQQEFSGFRNLRSHVACSLWYR